MLLATPERASITRHARLLVDALRARGEQVELKVEPHHEWRVAGRRVGGLTAQWFQRYVNHHALDPAVAGRRTRIVTVHDLAEELFPEHYRGSVTSRLHVRILRARAKRAPFILTPSEVTKRDIVERWGVAAERIFVAPWGLRHDEFRLHPDVAREPGLLVTWIDDQPRKNLILVMRAMKLLRDEGRAVRLERAGGAWEGADWRPVAREARLDVTERGFVPREELPRLAARGSVFVWPSFHEGFGWPPLEALACGTPVAALDTPINREVLGDAAVYFENEPEDAARALRQALDAPPPAARLVAQAARFTWERCAQAHAAAYRAAGL